MDGLVLATKEQIRQIHAAMPADIRSDADAKANLIVQFTEDNDKPSTKDLAYHQAEELIYFLNKGERKPYAHYAAFQVTNKQHMRILSQARQLGWEVYNEKYGRNVADLERLGRWIATKTSYKTPMKRLTSKQLSKVIAQLEKIVKYEYAKQANDKD